ncbi:hypothetical protein GF327_05560 [Candidatus Woesearchaeota archaeon]|nr:hypothetical protein [Candidatus Woesearchaeota archaeon]
MPNQKKKNRVKLGPTCSSITSPFCTKEGIALLFFSAVVMLRLPRNYSWVSLLLILSSYIIPVIKERYRRRK